MSGLKADFTVRHDTYPYWLKGFLLALAVAMLVLTIFCYQRLKTQIAEQQAEKQSQVVVDLPTLSKDEHLLFERLNDINSELNSPWLVLLTELEMLKAEHPRVIIHRIKPNMKNRTLNVSAQVNGFDNVVKFISAMRERAFFSTVNLIQHEDKGLELKSMKQGEIEFSLMAAWEESVE